MITHQQKDAAARAPKQREQAVVLPLDFKGSEENGYTGMLCRWPMAYDADNLAFNPSSALS
jgi:hypothetical protein